MTTSDRRYYTIAGAARHLHVSPSTVWRWIAAGRLPAKRLGPKTIRISPEDLAALERPVRASQNGTSMGIEQFKQRLATPPTPEELARRQAVIARTIEHRKDLVITPLTTADLIHHAREEEIASYDLDR